MSISEAAIAGAGAVDVAPPRAAAISRLVSSRVVAREAVVVAVIVAGLAALVAPRDLGIALVPHPGWAAVILLSARYGSRGFAFALLATCGALTLAALALRLDLGPLVTAASSSAPDLGALAVSVLVAWIASAHEGRIRDLTERAAALESVGAATGATIAELRDTAVALRGRADRMDHSLTFLRDVSARLASGDALVSARAALELALARTGARAGVVQLVERGRLCTTASLGDWTSQSARPPEVFADRTIAKAFANAAPVRAIDLADAGHDDSDVATPIADDEGRVWGVLALRGVPSDSLCHALVHDLGIVAHWFASAVPSRALERIPTPPVPAERDRAAQPRSEERSEDASRARPQHLN